MMILRNVLYAAIAIYFHKSFVGKSRVGFGPLPPADWVV